VKGYQSDVIFTIVMIINYEKKSDIGSSHVVERKRGPLLLREREVLYE
jgi:hypothetical protein